MNFEHPIKPEESENPRKSIERALEVLVSAGELTPNDFLAFQEEADEDMEAALGFLYTLLTENGIDADGFFSQNVV